MMTMDEVRSQRRHQADVIKTLKAASASKEELASALAALQELDQQLKEMSLNDSVDSDLKQANAQKREALDALMKQRFFVVPSFEIYGGVGGLYDYGPTGTAVKENILTFWRQHFILAEQMLEVSTSALTLSNVLKTSGHVDKFTDFMVKDVETGDPYRADKLLEAHIDQLLEDIQLGDNARAKLKGIRAQADAYSQEELHAVLKELNVVATETGNPISAPFEFNLMFGTPIGPTGKIDGFLRPETAQGIFTNFRRLIEFNSGRMPFAAAQIGLAFRNEIAPRSGLLRVREFQMAEIEHFVHPKRKEHIRFQNVADIVLNLLPGPAQDGQDLIIKMSAASAVEQGIINNQTLAYFMARTQLFLLGIGIIPSLLRFRQHKATEMAHYASDCWDAEIYTTYGWIECVGHADRSCFDLTQHSKVTNVDLTAYDQFDHPKQVEFVRANINRKKLGPKFRKDAKIVDEYLEELALDTEGAFKMMDKLKIDGFAEVTLCNKQTYRIEPDMINYEMVTEMKSGETYTPAVIEPSFGIGRIVYCLLEHCFSIRPEEEREVTDATKVPPKRHLLSFPARIAPIKVSVLPLNNNAALRSLSSTLTQKFLEAGVTVNEDCSSASIGKRYSRADEIGIPFGVTIDLESIKDQSVTIRERDSMEQIRVPMSDCVSLISQICQNLLSWEQALATHPTFTA